jgi:hypothetical protein
MKKFFAVISTVFIAVALSIVAVAAPASAHSATLSGSAVCNTDGSAIVTWTVSNDYNELLNVTASNNAAIPVGATVAATGGGKNTTATFTQNVPAPAGGTTVSATVSFVWSGDNFPQNNTKASVPIPSNCKVPTPQDAVANLVFTPATCTGAETVSEGTTKYASWDGLISYTGSGHLNYKATAKSIPNHQFSNGSSTLTLSGTLHSQLSGISCDNTTTKVPICHATGSNSNPYVSESVSYDSIINPSGHGSSGVNVGDIIPPFTYVKGGVSGSYAGQNWDATHQAIYNNGCKVPPPAVCIPNSSVTYHYTQNDANSGYITVTDVANSTGVLCHPFWVTATSWTFTNDSSVWPQNRDVVDKLAEITGPGTYDFAAPVTCGQGDIYASFDSTAPSLNPGPVLYGPSNPFAEHFLSDMGFSGSASPTYTQDNANCFQPIQETGSPTTTAVSCTAGSSNSITAPAVPGGVWTVTDNDGHVLYSSTIGVGLPTFTPAGSSSYTITLADGSSTDGYHVTGTSTPFTPVSIGSLDCNTKVVPATPTATKIEACDVSGSVQITPTTGVDYYINGTQVTSGLTVLDSSLETGLSGSEHITAVAEAGYEFAQGTQDHWKFYLGHETSCTFQTTFGDCVAAAGVSSESVSMTFDNPGNSSATFEVTGGSNNIDQTFTVPANTTSVVTLVDASASSGDTFEVSINGGPQQAVSVPVFAGCAIAIAGDPSVTQATCNADGQVSNNNASITIDLEPGLIYSITGPAGFTELDNLTTASNGGTAGQFVAATGIPAGNYTVSVTAAPGYTLDSSLQAPTWPFALSLPQIFCGIGVSVTPADCPAPPNEIGSAVFKAATTGVPSITVDLNPNVIYTARDVSQSPEVDTVLSSATTDVAPDEYFVDVTLSPAGVLAGYVLPSGSTSFGPFDLTAFCPPTAAAWHVGATGTDAVCTSGTTTDGVITLVHLASETGKVTYTVTNTVTSAVVYSGNTDLTVNVPAGTYNVHATVPTGDGIVGNMTANDFVNIPVSIGTSSTDCGDGDLAFTGGTIAWLGFLLAGGMLFLGFALLYMRRRGHRTAE